MLQGCSNKQKYHLTQTVLCYSGANVKLFSGKSLHSLVSPSLLCLKNQHANLSRP